MGSASHAPPTPRPVHSCPSPAGLQGPPDRCPYVSLLIRSPHGSRATSPRLFDRSFPSYSE